MKQLKLLVFTLALGLILPTKPTMAQDYRQPGVLILKVKSESNMRKLNTFRSSSDLVGVQQLQQLFPEHLNHSTAPELANIYRLTFPKEVNLDSLIRKFSALQWVEYAEPDYLYAPLGATPNDQYAANHWGHLKAKVYEAWDISQGEDIVVGVIDDGFVINHPDLKNQFYYNEAERNGKPGIDDDNNGVVDDSVGYDFGDMDNNVMAKCRDHGMEVAGIVAAEANNKIGVFGVAPKAKIMPLKVAVNDCSHYRNTLAAIKYAADNGCRVINLSWGRSGQPSRYEEEIINYCVLEKNVVVVAAAGNNHRHKPYYPASYENILSVTHSNSGDAHYPGGTRNHFVDIMAPGVGIPTTRNKGYKLHVIGSSYAAPFVSGCAALLAAKFPKFSAKQIAQRLRVTADASIYEISANKNAKDLLGSGRVNALRSLTEKNETPALRLTDYRLESSQGQRLVPGDKIKIHTVFTNYLSPTSDKLQVKLTSPSPLVRVLKDAATLAPIGTLNKSQSTTFEFKISKDTPPNAQIPLRFAYTDGKYTDYQYIYLMIRPDPLVYKLNRIALGVDTDGRIGVTGTKTDPRGPGFYYDPAPNPLAHSTRTGISLMKSSGLIIAAAPDKVSDAVMADNPEKRNSDFTATQNIGLNGTQIYEYQGDFVSFKGDFEDYSSNKNPIGLKITQTLTAYQTTPDWDYVINEYQITNQSGTTIPKLYFSLFVDWDLPKPQDEQARWDDARKLAYLYQDGHYVGIKVLHETPIHHALNLKKPSPPNPDLSDGFSDAEKYAAISKGIANKTAKGEDLAHIVGADLSPLYKGNTVSVAFVMMYAPSREKLFAVAERSNFRTKDLKTGIITGTKNYRPTPRINLWPNPASAYFFIDFGRKLSTPAHLKLLQTNGKVVGQWHLKAGQKHFRCNLPTLAPNMYLLNIKIGNQNISQKIYLE